MYGFVPFDFIEFKNGYSKNAPIITMEEIKKELNSATEYLKSMKKGMIFDLYQDGQTTKRVMAVNENDVLVLEDQTFIFNIDFENEVEEILIDNILNYPFS